MQLPADDSEPVLHLFILMSRAEQNILFVPLRHHPAQHVLLLAHLILNGNSLTYYATFGCPGELGVPERNIPLFGSSGLPQATDVDQPVTTDGYL